MRTKNSIKNVIISIVCNLITILIGFKAQSVFLSVLGIEYSGLNGVFGNIISMLSIAELGIGTAIIYHLYQPVAENDISTIRRLMRFYAKSYHIIALTVFILGICILPFLPIIVSGTTIPENIYFIYLLFLIDSVVSYFIAYKRSIIYANQKNRIVDLIHLLYTITVNITQIVILIYTKNYIIYLAIRILCRFIENVIIGIVANKMYPYLKEKETSKIDKNTKKEIQRMVKGQLFHQIGGYIVMGTDSIIISSFLGLSTAGVYVNYNLITNAANTVLAQVFSSLTASVGNLLVENNKIKTYQVYKKISFINYMIYALASIGLYFTINPFIQLWLHNDSYLFAHTTVILISLNFYLQGMRRTIQTFASAAGICHENRFVPLIEAVVNLVVSIAFVIILGFPGVIIGTITSTFVLYFYGFPKFIFEPLFNQKKRTFVLEQLKLLFILILTFSINYVANYFLLNNITNLYINILISGCLCILITTFIFYLCFHKTEEFKFYKYLFFNKLKRRNRYE